MFDVIIKVFKESKSLLIFIFVGFIVVGFMIGVIKKVPIKIIERNPKDEYREQALSELSKKKSEEEDGSHFQLKEKIETNVEDVMDKKPLIETPENTNTTENKNKAYQDQVLGEKEKEKTRKEEEQKEQKTKGVEEQTEKKALTDKEKKVLQEKKDIEDFKKLGQEDKEEKENQKNQAKDKSSKEKENAKSLLDLKKTPMKDEIEIPDDKKH